MQELSILRDCPRKHRNYLRYTHAPRRDTHSRQSPHSSEAEDNPPDCIRHGNLRRYRRNHDKSLLPCPEPHLLRVHELVLPRSNGRHGRHKHSAYLVVASRALPWHHELERVKEDRCPVSIRAMDVEPGNWAPPIRPRFGGAPSVQFAQLGSDNHYQSHKTLIGYQLPAE